MKIKINSIVNDSSNASLVINFSLLNEASQVVFSETRGVHYVGTSKVEARAHIKNIIKSAIQQKLDENASVLKEEVTALVGVEVDIP